MNHWDKVASSLHDYGLDAILLTGKANRFYASGFQADEEGGIALVTEKGNFFFTDSRYIEAAEAKIQNAAIACIDRNNSYMDRICDALEMSECKTVGFEEEIMTVADWRCYSEHMALQPASAMMAALRQSKDPEEIRRMEQAQQIAETAFSQLLKELRPGMTERELAARLQYLAITGGAEKMSFDTIVASGPNGSMPHAVPTDRKVREGEFITFDFGCVYKGYCSDTTRTVALGRVTEEMEHVYQIVYEAQSAGISAARGGITGRNMDAAARDVIDKAGYGAYFGHALGHSLGIDVHEEPVAAPRNTQPLPNGTVISVEPGIYLPGKFGVRIEDVVVLEEDGCRDLTGLKRELQSF